MGRRKGHRPIRTCVCCGRKAVKDELIRLVLDSHSQLIKDDSATIQARGAYVCHSSSCVAQLRKRPLNRFFRTGENISISPALRVQNGDERWP
jgi:predicted RNA-binding protein YlxR (DUF448 family)